MITPGELRREAREREQRGSPATPTATVVHSHFRCGDRLHEHGERVARRLRDSHHLGQLADGDVEAEPDDEALEHGPREEAGDEPHPREPADDVDHADHQRQRNGQGDVVRRARARGRDEGDRGGGQRRHRRAGTHIEVARAAQHAIADNRERHHVETVLDRHTRDPGVGQRLGHHERPDGQPGHRVGGQPLAVVATKPRGDQPHDRMTVPPAQSANLTRIGRRRDAPGAGPSRGRHEGVQVQITVARERPLGLEV